MKVLDLLAWRMDRLHDHVRCNSFLSPSQTRQATRDGEPRMRPKGSIRTCAHGYSRKIWLCLGKDNHKRRRL